DETVQDDGPALKSRDCAQAVAHASESSSKATLSAKCPLSSARAHLSRLFPRSATICNTAQAPAEETAAVRTGSESGWAAGSGWRSCSNNATIWWIKGGIPCPVTAEIATT